jgi:diguanylate cyclase (GGDEF)-like protein
VLREIGEVLRATIRRGDVAGRIGGEEFALLLPDTELDEARQLAERVRIAVRELRPSGLLVTISCGVAQHEPGTSLTAALDLADSRLYHAKAAGRDQVVG